MFCAWLTTYFHDVYESLRKLIIYKVNETFLRFRRYEESPTPETYCRFAVTKNTTFQSRKYIFVCTAAAQFAAIGAHILWICGRSPKNRVYTTLSDGWCHQTIIKTSISTYFVSYRVLAKWIIWSLSQNIIITECFKKIAAVSNLFCCPPIKSA